jgi:2-oxoglutarate ferredoxin oxidoreductase subunit delta
LEVRRLTLRVADPAPPTTSVAPIPPAQPIALQPLAIASDRCKGCELCVTACPHHVLALDEAVVNVLGYHPVVLVDPAGCTSCVLCARVCPDAVFTVYAPRKEGRP